MACRRLSPRRRPAADPRSPGDRRQARAAGRSQPRSSGPKSRTIATRSPRPASVHPTVPEIFLVSNMAPVNRAPPRRPEPPLTADGRLPVQYPHRKGWHTDQSYRRPPPDISLFYAVTPVARERGQTLFADGTAAYAALPPHLKAKVDGLQGLHCQPGTRPLARRRAGGPQDRRGSRPMRARSAARRAPPSGDGKARALSLRMGPDGLARRARSSACSPGRTATAPRCSTS